MSRVPVCGSQCHAGRNFIEKIYSLLVFVRIGRTVKLNAGVSSKHRFNAFFYLLEFFRHGRAIGINFNLVVIRLMGDPLLLLWRKHKHVYQINIT